MPSYQCKPSLQRDQLVCGLTTTATSKNHLIKLTPSTPAFIFTPFLWVHPLLPEASAAHHQIGNHEFCKKQLISRCLQAILLSSASSSALNNFPSAAEASLTRTQLAGMFLLLRFGDLKTDPATLYHIFWEAGILVQNILFIDALFKATQASDERNLPNMTIYRVPVYLKLPKFQENVLKIF